jgi:HKD family nuclease
LSSIHVKEHAIGDNYHFSCHISGGGMLHKRINIRVPFTGEAKLFSKSGAVIQARAVDISIGGIRITNHSIPLENTEYTIKISTAGRGIVKFRATLAHENEEAAGFKIIEISSKDLQTIYHMIADFQATEEFIRYIDEYNILSDWFIDSYGKYLDVTFEVAT